MVRTVAKDRRMLKISIAKEGYTIRSFAKKIDMSPAFLSQILNGYNNPSPVIAKKIADGLNEDVDKFFLYQVFDDLQK